MARGVSTQSSRVLTAVSHDFKTFNGFMCNPEARSACITAGSVGSLNSLLAVAAACLCGLCIVMLTFGQAHLAVVSLLSFHGCVQY